MTQINEALRHLNIPKCIKQSSTFIRLTLHFTVLDIGEDSILSRLLEALPNLW